MVAAGLLVLLLAAAGLDLFYYQPLLRGAVNALLELERKHDVIKLSTTIEATVGRGQYAPHVAYGAVLTMLSVFTLWAYVQHHRERKHLQKRDLRRMRVQYTQSLRRV